MKERNRYKIVNGKRRVICCERGVFGIKHDCCKSNPQQEVEKLIKVCSKRPSSSKLGW